jgi:hypothetical protein
MAMAHRTSVHPSDNQPSPKSGTADYRVVPNGRHWDVLRDGTFIGTVTRDVNGAIELAMTEARREHESGTAVSVSVQENDGSRRHVWP